LGTPHSFPLLRPKLRSIRSGLKPNRPVRAALEQRAAEWKADLRSEPHLARLVLRKFVGPIVLFDDSKRPAFVKWEAQPTAELLAGLAPTLEAVPMRTLPHKERGVRQQQRGLSRLRE